MFVCSLIFSVPDHRQDREFTQRWRKGKNQSDDVKRARNPSWRRSKAVAQSNGGSTCRISEELESRLAIETITRLAHGLRIFAASGTRRSVNPRMLSSASFSADGLATVAGAS